MKTFGLLFSCILSLCKVASGDQRALPDGFPIGSSAVIRGIPIADASYKALGINLLTHSSTGESGDKALHLAARYDEGIIVTNTFILGGGWQQEERHGNSPIRVGQPFEVLIVAETSHFNVYINGNHYLFFKYRMPLQRITCLEVVASVTVTSITVDVAVGHAWPLPKGFPVGSRAVITGVPDAVAADKVFSLNFLTYSPYGYDGNIAYRLSAKYSEGNITGNNFMQGLGWQHEQLNRDAPIRSGRPFTIIILSEASCFGVFVNNSRVLDFPHRVPPDRIKYFQIRGSVAVTSVTFDDKPLDSAPECELKQTKEGVV